MWKQAYKIKNFKNVNSNRHELVRWAAERSKLERVANERIRGTSKIKNPSTDDSNKRSYLVYASAQNKHKNEFSNKYQGATRN